VNRQKKILVVEDSERDRRLMNMVLRNKGYMVIEATDGLAAIAEAKKKLPDLILMDIKLPKIDGMEVTRILRRDERFRFTPIVAVTANAMRGDREDILAAGCTEYVSKPVRFRELLALIDALLAGTNAQVNGE